MWRIRRKVKQFYNRLVNFVFFMLTLIVGVSLLVRFTNHPFENSILQEATNTVQSPMERLMAIAGWIQEWWIAIGAILVIALVSVKVFPYYWKARKVRRSDIRTVDQMTGDQFEEFLVIFFRLLGFTASKTKRTRDQGADLIVNVNGERVVVQAKRSRNPISNSAVQEVVAAKAFYNATDAWVVTNSYFTQPAKELARANEVELWDRDRLISELSKLNMRQYNRNTGT
jgi:restriction system protein